MLWGTCVVVSHIADSETLQTLSGRFTMSHLAELVEARLVGNQPLPEEVVIVIPVGVCPLSKTLRAAGRVAAAAVAAGGTHHMAAC